jgi:tetratricopeptide (TPR) repeat protein/2-polyprenyl-3-methyl-5-hydroxy-6-metoxy-1,4-benzoquinol methylase
MNRRERRAAKSRGHGGGGLSGSSDALFAQAVRHHQLGQWFEAEAVCRTIVERDPRHIGSLHLLGMLAQSRGSHDEAAARFRSLLAAKPDIAAVHYSLGRSLAETGRLEEAVAAFERARALDAAASPKQPAGPDYARTYLNLGNLGMERGRLAEAHALYERALALKPELGEAHNNLGAVLLSQGKLAEASARFVRALDLAPELIDLFANLVATLYRLNPALGEAVERAGAAWPSFLSEQELFGPKGMAAIASDELLLRVLERITVRDMGLERFITALRRVLLDRVVAADGGDGILRLACAVARQCFINEYVFVAGPDELAKALSISDASFAGQDVSAQQVAAVASYRPLHAAADPQALLQRSWPEPVAALLTQQIREVESERLDRDAIARLTPIEDETSREVRQQYEENPYPRWVIAPAGVNTQWLDEHVRQKFPYAPIRASATRPVDILIAGCGTGQNSISVARNLRDARVLAVDLSLASLSYARRKTREIGLSNIEYGQADILQLPSLGRSFDLVDASGVLHHLADPMAGWRTLLSLVRAGGFMRIGLYSELARRDVVAAQRFAAERGYCPTPADIRRLRQELMATPLRGITKFHDFFSTSECRDLLFHVQEHRHSIPQIGSFLRQHNLSFIGFELDATLLQAYRTAFPNDPAMTNLEHWHSFESERPDSFAGMYQFWVQRS